MKTLYIECNMGAAGDMLTAALLELYGDTADFLNRINQAGIPGVCVTAEAAVKCGIGGTQVHVSIGGEEESDHHHDDHHDHHHHHHNGMADIEHLINHLNVSDVVKRDALAVYKIIAEAESQVHGEPVSEIHFHEVGALDAVADIVGVCLLMEALGAKKIIASPIHVGSGQVRCAHGLLPVPAPATALILKNVPIYGGTIKSELCTPTGAALLVYFAQHFGAMPVMTVSKIGYGMGHKDFESVNAVRVLWGETADEKETVTELSCNLDDMTPEAVAFAQQLLMAEGALDVYTASIVMKKGRMGVLLTCMCKNEMLDKMTALIFKHTTTLGIRAQTSRRFTLHREQQVVETAYGSVSVKTSSGYGVERVKPEYEDLAQIARANGLSLAEAAKLV